MPYFFSSLFLLLLAGCGGATHSDSAGTTADAVVHFETFVDLEAIDERAPGIRRFCGRCHAVPLPQSFPKDAWYEEVRRGFDFYYQSGQTDADPPSAQDVTAFYRQYAPVELPEAEWSESDVSRIQFSRQDVRLSWPEIKTPPAVSFVDIRGEGETAPGIWFSDMRSGAAGLLAVSSPDIGNLSPLAAASPAATLLSNRNGIARYPVAVREADLDQNGRPDLIFCDLGSFLPEDHQHGRLIWLPDGATATPGEPVILLDQVGRVADVCIEDFTGNGLPDLVVAEFGWHKTGGIHLLTNEGITDGQPRFSHQILDERPGTIHIVPADLNHDGRLDFVALISQEHEQVVAFLNKSDGFQPELIYAAPDPSWGSSGIQLVDLDGDGDLDILYTNGDTFDSYLMKPYHGIWWLENKGSMPFEPHRLAAMPGVHRALAVDLDGDGDLDIVASALLPGTSSRGRDPQQLLALVWLEQTQPGIFVCHVIERGQPIYAAIAVHDLNADGRPDIVAGCFHEQGDEHAPLIRIFWNTSTEKSKTPVTDEPKQSMQRTPDQQMQKRGSKQPS